METRTIERELTVALPPPRLEGPVSVEQALARRRSVRAFEATPLQLAELGQLLWSAQGSTGVGGRRTTPSAGGTYPLEVHVLVGDVAGLAPGHYRYLPRRGLLLGLQRADLRGELARAARDEAWIACAPATMVVTAVFERTLREHGERGRRYVHFEAGCAAQSLQLQAAALDLSTTVVGAFDDDRLACLLELPLPERPLAILPVGHAREGARAC